MKELQLSQCYDAKAIIYHTYYIIYVYMIIYIYDIYIIYSIQHSQFDLRAECEIKRWFNVSSYLCSGLSLRYFLFCKSFVCEVSKDFKLKHETGSAANKHKEEQLNIITVCSLQIVYLVSQTLSRCLNVTLF